MPSGRELIADIDACTPGPGQVALWWLGQHGFVLKLAGRVVWIDAFLAPHRQRRVLPLVAPAAVTNADLVLGTHDHGDHIDRPSWPTIAAASPRALFVVPEALRPGLARELGIAPERFVGADDGVTREIAGLRITGVAAAHETLHPDEHGHHPFLGYVVAGGDAAVYHAGDCCVYEGLVDRLRQVVADPQVGGCGTYGQPARRYTAVLLPINGRDARRLAAGIIGNMNAAEAADLAGAIDAACTIPTHWDMFANNPGDPDAFLAHVRARHPRLRVHVPRHGERLVL